MYSQRNSFAPAAVSEPDADTLGPRYLATYELYEEGGTFVQHLYPFARPQPMAFAPAQATTTGQRSKASWIEVSDDLGPLLVGIGVPRIQPPATHDHPSDGSPAWSARIGIGIGTVILAAALTVTFAIRRRARTSLGPLPA